MDHHAPILVVVFKLLCGHCHRQCVYALRTGEGMDDLRSFTVRLIGLPHDQYKCINLDLCVPKVHVLKLQLVFLVLFMVTLASSVRIRRTRGSACVSTNGCEKNSQTQ
jgi:hypothetical protein